MRAAVPPDLGPLRAEVELHAEAGEVELAGRRTDSPARASAMPSVLPGMPEDLLSVCRQARRSSRRPGLSPPSVPSRSYRVSASSAFFALQVVDGVGRRGERADLVGLHPREGHRSGDEAFGGDIDARRNVLLPSPSPRCPGPCRRPWASGRRPSKRASRSPLPSPSPRRSWAGRGVGAAGFRAAA